VDVHNFLLCLKVKTTIPKSCSNFCWLFILLNICEACYSCNCQHCIILYVLVDLCKIMGWSFQPWIMARLWIWKAINEIWVQICRAKGVFLIEWTRMLHMIYSYVRPFPLYFKKTLGWLNSWGTTTNWF
jgi:hypothetical protein